MSQFGVVRMSLASIPRDDNNWLNGGGLSLDLSFVVRYARVSYGAMIFEDQKYVDPRTRALVQ